MYICNPKSLTRLHVWELDILLLREDKSRLCELLLIFVDKQQQSKNNICISSKLCGRDVIGLDRRATVYLLEIPFRVVTDCSASRLC